MAVSVEHQLLETSIENAMPGATSFRVREDDYSLEDPDVRRRKSSLSKEEELKRWKAELGVISQKMAEMGVSSENISHALPLWVAIRKYMKVPNKVWDSELKSDRGVFSTFALGVAKTLEYGKPKLVLESTLCPSYVPERERARELNKPPVYTKNNIEKINKLKAMLFDFAQSGLFKCVSSWNIHTPFKEDRIKAPNLIGDLSVDLQKPQNGVDWLEFHQKITQRVVDELDNSLGGWRKVVLRPDLQLVEPKALELEGMVEKSQSVKKALDIFEAIGYKFARGNGGWVRFALYASTAMAYGNKDDDLDLGSEEPVKIFVGLETSSEIYIGQKLGIDFRYMVPGYSLPILIPPVSLRAPWQSGFED